MVHTVTAADVFGAYVGESERRLREVFAAARADAEAGKIAIVFLDEVSRLQGLHNLSASVLTKASNSAAWFRQSYRYNQYLAMAR